MQRGHAIECRVYAEDPDAGFLPSPGRIVGLRPPGGPGVRDDSGVYEGWTVPIDYDPLLSKLVAWGETREVAIGRMRRALAEYRVLGIRTTLPFFARVLRHPDFLAGEFDTSFVQTAFPAARDEREPAVEAAIVAAAIHALGARRGLRAPGGAPADAALPPWRAVGRREAQGRLGS